MLLPTYKGNFLGIKVGFLEHFFPMAVGELGGLAHGYWQAPASPISKPLTKYCMAVAVLKWITFTIGWKNVYCHGHVPRGFLSWNYLNGFSGEIPPTIRPRCLVPHVPRRREENPSPSGRRLQMWDNLEELQGGKLLELFTDGNDPVWTHSSSCGFAATFNGFSIWKRSWILTAGHRIKIKNK